MLDYNKNLTLDYNKNNIKIILELIKLNVKKQLTQIILKVQLENKSKNGV